MACQNKSTRVKVNGKKSTLGRESDLPRKYSRYSIKTCCIFPETILWNMWLDPLDFLLLADGTTYSKLNWKVAGTDPQLPLRAQSLNIATQQVKCWDETETEFLGRTYL